MTGKDTIQIPADTPLAAELADDDVVEMANLTTTQTGVAGTIFISQWAGTGAGEVFLTAGAVAT